MDSCTFFVDKCLPFGAAISCALFQAFSNAIAHLVRFRTKKEPVNYLDDFLFIALLRLMCAHQLQEFIKICEEINFPLSMEKTQWPTTRLVFLGLLLDMVNQMVLLPTEKVVNGREMIKKLIQKHCYIA